MRLKTKFQDEDFELGEVVDATIRLNEFFQLEVVVIKDGKKIIQIYDSLDKLKDDWEDAPEEPKKYWFIDAYGNIVRNEITKHYGDEYTDMTDAYESQKRIGNRFETEEEVVKSLEKLKAFKRLKHKGFRFEGWTIDDGLKISICTNMGSEGIYEDDKEKLRSDLDTCFGGGE